MNRFDGEEKICLLDTLQCEKNEENEITTQMTVQKLIHDLDTRERTIIQMRYYQDFTQQQVADYLGISQVQVSRIEKKILIQMREKLII